MKMIKRNNLPKNLAQNHYRMKRKQIIRMMMMISMKEKICQLSLNLSISPMMKMKIQIYQIRWKKSCRNSKMKMIMKMMISNKKRMIKTISKRAIIRRHPLVKLKDKTSQNRIRMIRKGLSSLQRN